MPEDTTIGSLEVKIEKVSFWISRILSLFLLISVFVGIYSFTHAAEKAFGIPVNEPPGWHYCQNCKTKFKCRAKNKNQRRRRPVAEFNRRTVQVGGMPIEIAEPNKVKQNCCSWCGFKCYLKLVRKTK